MIDNRPWINRYDEGVPASLEYPDICVHDYLAQQSKINPGRIAVISDSESINYRSLSDMASSLTFQLYQHGIRPGDRVGICLPNSPGFVVAFFGVLQAGAVVAAMNPLFPQRELEYQVKTADVKLVITNAGKENDFRSMDLPRKPDVLVITKTCKLPGFTSKQFSDTERTVYPVTKGSIHAVAPSSPAVLQFSGGTTGTPKAAVGTHKNLVANVTQFRSWLVNLEDGKETFLVAIPMYHVYGLVLGLLLGVATGATMVLVENPGNVDEMLLTIDRYPISYFPAVPSLFNMINNHPGVINGAFDLHHIKACISGSAPLLESLRLDFEKFTGGSLVEGFGLSEAPTATHCNPILGEKRTSSIGLPLPDVDCRIISIDDYKVDMPLGEEGELLIRGPQVMTGYFNAEKETASTLAGGWLHTGDIARMDKDGYFYISGRIKDLIKVHGMQVWPVEVEEVLSKHPAIKECAAAGIPDDRSGERVKAWLVMQSDENISLAEIREFCRGKIAEYKIPSEIMIRSALPKTPVGKVLRRVLVQEHLESR